MASNTKNFSKKPYVWLKVEVSVLEINHDDTKCKLNIKLKMGTNEPTYRLYGSGYWIKIDGNQVASGTTTYDFRGPTNVITIRNIDRWVDHDASGTHSIQIKGRLSDSFVGYAEPTVNITVEYEGGKVWIKTSSGSIVHGEVYVGTPNGVKRAKEVWIGTPNGKRKAK